MIGEAVGEFAFEVQNTGFITLPFQRGQGNLLCRPDGINMRVGEVSQPKVRPERFRQIDHDVTAVVPRSEDAELGLALGSDSAIKKTDPWMASARIREHVQCVGWFVDRLVEIDFGGGDRFFHRRLVRR